MVIGKLLPQAETFLRRLLQVFSGALGLTLKARHVCAKPLRGSASHLKLTDNFCDSSFPCRKIFDEPRRINACCFAAAGFHRPYRVELASQQTVLPLKVSHNCGLPGQRFAVIFSCDRCFFGSRCRLILRFSKVNVTLLHPRHFLLKLAERLCRCAQLGLRARELRE